MYLFFSWLPQAPVLGCSVIHNLISHGEPWAVFSLCYVGVVTESLVDAHLPVWVSVLAASVPRILNSECQLASQITPLYPFTASGGLPLVSPHRQHPLPKYCVSK